jgi:hypothetical protein
MVDLLTMTRSSLSRTVTNDDGLDLGTDMITRHLDPHKDAVWGLKCVFKDRAPVYNPLCNLTRGRATIGAAYRWCDLSLDAEFRRMVTASDLETDAVTDGNFQQGHVLHAVKCCHVVGYGAR